jgi:Tetratricopeptide repeat
MVLKASVQFKIEVGADHPDSALSIYNLGTLLLEQRRMEEARQLFRSALGISERVLD